MFELPSLYYLISVWKMRIWNIERVLILFVMILFLKFKAINSKGVLGLYLGNKSVASIAYVTQHITKNSSKNCFPVTFRLFNKIALFCEQVNSVSNCQISPCIDKFDRKIRDHAVVCT